MSYLVRFLFAALLAAPVPALAQSQGGGPIVPPRLTGQGVQTATGSSASINAANVAATGSSPAFPTSLPNSFMTVKVQGNQAAGVAVCWIGGTCTTASGEIIEPGESATRNLFNTFGTATPTVISLSGSVIISVEW